MTTFSNLKPALTVKSVLVISATLFVCASAGEENSYIAPRTANGVPDLQGMWTNNTITPFSRPAEFSELAISAEQARALEMQVAAGSKLERTRPIHSEQPQTVTVHVRLSSPD